MVYTEVVKISKSDYEYYNKLFELNFEEDSEDKINNYGGRIDDYIGITSVEFSNGNYITIDLASGSSNYYDNIVLWSKDGQELVCADCDYNIGNFELFYNEDVYNVIFELEI